MSLRAVLPSAVFVFLWSTGFIVAKLGLPYAQSGTFLTLRYWLAAVLMGGLAVLGAATWPRRASDIGHCAVAGLLMHFVYIGGVFTAIERGLPAGVSALIVSLQPLLTAIAAGPLLGETVTRWQWLGLVLGLIGTALVPRHRDYDGLPLSQSRIGKSCGGTRTSMLRAMPGWRRINPARSRVSTIWWIEGGVTWKWRCMSASAGA